VRPWSVVRQERPSAAVTVAPRPSIALTATKSTASGKETRTNRTPSVVTNTAPARPTIQHTEGDAADPAVAAEDSIEIPVQINGKLRGRVTVPAGASEDEIKRAARAVLEPQLAVVKEIVVPGRLVNFVVKNK